MSRQYLCDNKQIQKKDFRLAMSVGKNNHYQLYEIMLRHFLQAAKQAGLAEGLAEMAIEQPAETLPGAIRASCESLPADFPGDIQDSVTKAALQKRERVSTALKEA